MNSESIQTQSPTYSHIDQQPHWKERDYQWNPYTAVARKTSQKETPADNPPNKQFRRVTGGPPTENVSEDSRLCRLQDSRSVCQVCQCDLSDHSFYFRRYKVCKEHARAGFVYFNHCLQRFCNRCGRFHFISEFDDNKRSCRQRLDKHNERRRQKRAEDKNKKLSLKSAGGVSKPGRPVAPIIDVEHVVDVVMSNSVQNTSESQVQSTSSTKLVSIDNQRNFPLSQAQFYDAPQLQQSNLEVQKQKETQEDMDLEVDLDSTSLPKVSNNESVQNNRLNNMLHEWWGNSFAKCNKVLSDFGSAFPKTTLGLEDMPYLLEAIERLDEKFQIPEGFDMSQLPFASYQGLGGSFSSAQVTGNVRPQGLYARPRLVDSAASWDQTQSSKKQWQTLQAHDNQSVYSYRLQASEPATSVILNSIKLPKHDFQYQNQADDFHQMIDNISSVQDDFIPLDKVPSFPSLADEDIPEDFTIDETTVTQEQDLKNEMSVILQEDFHTKLQNYTFKLYNTTPDQLEKSLRDQLVQAMCQQSYLQEVSMRPGCIELSVFGITVYLDISECQQQPSIEQVAQALQTHAFWENRTYTVQSHERQTQAVHHGSISQMILYKATPEQAFKLDSIYPKVATPGDALIIEGSYLEGTTVIARMNGQDVVLEVEESSEEFATLVLPEDCQSGLLKIQLKKGNWLSNAEVVVVINDDDEVEKRVLEDIGMLDKIMDNDQKEQSFLIQLGLLLDFQTSLNDHSDESCSVLSIKRVYSDMEKQLLQKFNSRIIIEAMKNGWSGVFNWAMQLFGAECSSAKEVVTKLETYVSPGLTLLHLAVNTGNPGALNVLFEWAKLHNYKWSCLSKAKGGLSPMHFAAMIADGGLMARLLVHYFQHGLDSINMPADDGKTTPISLAKHRGQAATFETMKILYAQRLQHEGAHKHVHEKAVDMREMSPFVNSQNVSSCEGVEIDTQSVVDNQAQEVVDDAIDYHTERVFAPCPQINRKMNRWDSDKKCFSVISSDLEDETTCEQQINNYNKTCHKPGQQGRCVHRWDSASSRLKRRQVGQAIGVKSEQSSGYCTNHPSVAENSE